MEEPWGLPSHQALAMAERARMAQERGLPVCLAADLCGPGKCSLAATRRVCGHVLKDSQVQREQKND